MNKYVRLLTLALALMLGTSLNAMDKKNAKRHDGDITAKWLKLMAAASKGELEDTKAVNGVIISGVTSLLKTNAGASGYDTEVLNKTNKEGWTALMAATTCWNTNVVKALLKAGADVDAQDNDGWTALMMAAVSGQKAIVQELLDAGADVTIKAKDGRTAAVIAAKKDHGDVVRLLESKVKTAGHSKNRVIIVGPKGDDSEESEPDVEPS